MGDWGAQGGAWTSPGEQWHLRMKNNVGKTAVGRRRGIRAVWRWVRASGAGMKGLGEPTLEKEAGPSLERLCKVGLGNRGFILRTRGSYSLQDFKQESEMIKLVIEKDPLWQEEGPSKGGGGVPAGRL